MVTPDDFWDATFEQVEDPNWRVYSYSDGALQFVCEDCHEDIWQGRTVASTEHEGLRLQSQYSPELDKVFCSASQRHQYEPKEFGLYPRETVPQGEITVEVMWVSLVGWSYVQSGPPITLPDRVDVIQLLDVSPVSVAETEEKPVDEYSLADLLNVGCEVVTPGGRSWEKGDGTRAT